ncbi:GNAT family N-acetyltransferase [Amycolatopsis sp. CA-230715]|uniref:GNAT family N-acetyltransferase n=1 Tax=Amycolatopsis sp. CA-230715 TaxID=2745196 RepID=UPI001C033101|nr:GNAT family N-acetyltransferase [Amycolatopsis sp. CA-230715]QWF86086.1 hypothetical protein HUW46_09567 [Amycolatopsis sp. CA-230715]
MSDYPQWTISRASAHECPEVLALLLGRAEWLKRRGSDQWSNFADSQERLASIISAGRTWLLREDSSGTAVGTITFVDADSDFWTPSEQAVPALYLAKLATDPTGSGRGLGRLLLHFALYRAWSDSSIREVRFDAWKTATGLHEYYRREGWTHLRTVDVPGRRSGALFSRPVDHSLAGMPNLDSVGFGQPTAFVGNPPRPDIVVEKSPREIAAEIERDG